MTKRNPLDRTKRSFTPDLPSLAQAAERLNRPVPAEPAELHDIDPGAPAAVPSVAPRSPEDLAAALREALGRLHHRIQAEAQRSLGRQRSLTQVLVLDQLHRNDDGLSSNELAERVQSAPASLASVLAHLEKSRLVQRKKVAGPARDLVRLTERGASETRDLVERHRRDLAEILSVLPEADRQAMALLLDRAIRRLQSRFERSSRLGN